MSEQTTKITEREWDYWPEPEGEPYEDADGTVVGFHDRTDDQDPARLRAEFEAYEGRPLVLHPILVRRASDIECRINGWEEGTFVQCTTRAKNPERKWKIVLGDEEAER